MIIESRGETADVYYRRCTRSPLIELTRAFGAQVNTNTTLDVYIHIIHRHTHSLLIKLTCAFGCQANTKTPQMYILVDVLFLRYS